MAENPGTHPSRRAPTTSVRDKSEHIFRQDGDEFGIAELDRVAKLSCEGSAEIRRMKGVLNSPPHPPLPSCRFWIATLLVLLGLVSTHFLLSHGLPSSKPFFMASWTGKTVRGIFGLVT